MMPPVGPAWLGAQLDGIDPSPVVAGAYLLSGLLLLVGLWLRNSRHSHRWAMAGIATGAAAAVYSHDVVNLPEMVSAVVIGGSIGLLLARRSAVAALLWLAVAGHGLLGVAAMAMAATLWRNPGAFGLLGDDGAVLPFGGGMLVAGFGLGVPTLAGALVLAFGRRLGGLPLLTSGAGWAAAALGFAIGNGAMVVAGGMAGVAGLRLAWRARRIASRALPSGAGLP